VIEEKQPENSCEKEQTPTLTQLTERINKLEEKLNKLEEKLQRYKRANHSSMCSHDIDNMVNGLTRF
jgi:predicted translin family RNA/ssDNA-binding protein